MSDSTAEITKVLALMPYLRLLYGDEVALGVTTKEKYVFYEMGRQLDLGIKLGDPVKEGSMSDNAMKTCQRVIRKMPRELFGIPYMGTVIPVTEDGRTVGSLAVVRPIDVQEKLQEVAGSMNSSIESVSAGSSSFAASAEQLAATSGELANNTEKIRNEIKDMDAILNLITDIAAQTHLLGLNAAIEAARAGDDGRGFNVVAEEIRKLAARTQSSTKDITQKLNRIKNNIASLSEHVLQIACVSQEQAATSEEISSSVQDLEPLAQSLVVISGEMIK